MTEYTPNIPLLRKAVEWAEAEAAKEDQEQSEWDQLYWRDVGFRACGTTYCIAGYVCEVSGEEWTSGVTTANGAVPRVAADLLGLGQDDAWALFDAENSIERVREVAERIAERAGERL